MGEYRLLKKDECDIKDLFWSYYIDLVRDKVIPYQWEILNDRIEDAEPSHAIDNFRIAAGDIEGHFYGEVFQDSDVSKWLEAVGNILMLSRDEKLEAQADSVIDIIARAQDESGYLDTYFLIEAPEKKWTNILECHELYCAGHFIEGAVSYYLATGKKKVFDVAVKLADYLYEMFGKEEGKLHGYPGHQEIEIALLKLYDVTGNEKYFELAQYFIDTRGTNQFFEEEFEKRDHVCQWTQAKVEEPNRWYNQFPYSYYNQFHLPVRKQKEAVGHAVRGVYMYTAMADIASRTKEKELFDACKNIWNNIVKKQLYITGGIGATHSGEAFTVAYDLPNDTNYSETCASIGLVFFAQKMLKNEVDRTYGDVMEQALYNTILGGMNYEGNRFFYVNPLEVVPETCLGNTERNHVKPVRQKWFSCACCPPNIARTIASLWQYIYTADEDTAYVHLYIGNESEIQLTGNTLRIRQTTDYPWSGKVVLEINADTEEPMTVALRIPTWSEDKYSICVDGVCQDICAEKNGYVQIKRNWKGNHQITLELKMEPKLVQANRKIHYNGGRAALVCGPVVYCLEEADNGKYLNQILVDAKSDWKVTEGTLGGKSLILEGRGWREQSQTDEESLYHVYHEEREEITITAVPYFLWNNRSDGEMQVWMRVGR